MFDRLEALIGKYNMNTISNKRILVLGVGGVGGYVVESLVRSGISNITIVDGDIVDKTNLNRQIIALHSTIGKPKVKVMKERMLDINPDIKIDTINKTIKPSDLKTLNLKQYDYVVDAIDDVKVKVELAKLAIDNDISIILSTGTARKMNPMKLTITTLNKTSYDSLAKILRRELKGYDTKKLTVLASTEEPIECKGTLGSTIFVPASAGILIASYIVRKIIK